MIKLNIPKERVVSFCQKHHICRLSLFGSVLRDDFSPKSDVDVLVEFEEGHTPGLTFFAMQDELSDILDRSVDLCTPEFLSRYFRQEVMQSAVPAYEQ